MEIFLCDLHAVIRHVTMVHIARCMYICKFSKIWYSFLVLLIILFLVYIENGLYCR